MGPGEYTEKPAENGRDVIVISDREEGEIIDASDLDEISDISTDEEILLRERIQVLESYNNALERKEAKKRIETRTSDAAGTPKKISLHTKPNKIARDSRTVRRSRRTFVNSSPIKRPRKTDPSHYKSRKYELEKKYRTYQKLTIIRSLSPKNLTDNREKHNVTKKHKVIISSSESSDEDSHIHWDKRRKLQEAIRISSKDNDKSSLKLRLFNMMHNSNKNNPIESATTSVEELEIDDKNANNDVKEQGDSNNDCLVSGDQCVETHEITPQKDEEKTHNQDDRTMSEDDLDCLRQLALQTKVKKKEVKDDGETFKSDVISTNSTDTVEKIYISNDNEHIKEKTSPATQDSAEDSDTADLRLICLKSAVLKKAMERKRRQKEQKRRSTTSEKQERLTSTSSLRELANICDHNNHTDVESVDMEIGASDEENTFSADDATVNPMTETQIELKKLDETLYSEMAPYCTYKLSSFLNGENQDMKENFLDHVDVPPTLPVEDLEEDEDILRAKLLNSLTSQNIQKMATDKNVERTDVLKENKQTGKSNIVINLRESSDESDNENIRNLTKMHEKLKQTEFEQSLDLFLKNARKQAETGKPLQQKHPVVNENIPPAKPSVKAVNHLPKSHQLEYKRLVKRMAELERVKQSRQATLKKDLECGKLKDSMKIKILQSCNDRTVIAENIANNVKSVLPKAKSSAVQPANKMPVMKTDSGVKDRSVVIKDAENYDQSSHESAITVSRRKIAHEASTVMRLRAEEATLGARARAAAAELRDARSALTNNRRALRRAQQALTTARELHNRLLRSSINQSTKYVNSKLTIPQTLSSQRTVVVQPENISGTKEKTDIAKKILVTNKKLSISLDVNKDTKTVGYVQKVVPEPEMSRKVEVFEKKSPNKLTNHTNDVKVTVPQMMKFNPDVMKSKSRIYTGETVLEVLGDSKDNKMTDKTKRLEATQDYKSPLEAINSSNSWCEDPNGVFCPFEVEGTCKDADCKYVHPKNT